MRIPAIAVVGDREVEDKGVSLRTRSEGDMGFKPIDALTDWLLEVVKEPIW
jgi:threonyl-tRNA synthetase